MSSPPRTVSNCQQGRSRSPAPPRFFRRGDCCHRQHVLSEPTNWRCLYEDDGVVAEDKFEPSFPTVFEFAPLEFWDSVNLLEQEIDDTEEVPSPIMVTFAYGIGALFGDFTGHQNYCLPVQGLDFGYVGDSEKTVKANKHRPANLFTDIAELATNCPGVPRGTFSHSLHEEDSQDSAESGKQAVKRIQPIAPAGPRPVRTRSKTRPMSTLLRRESDTDSDATAVPLQVSAMSLDLGITRPSTPHRRRPASPSPTFTKSSEACFLPALPITKSAKTAVHWRKESLQQNRNFATDCWRKRAVL